MTTRPFLEDAFRERYTIERELGRGGMATVYLAQDLKLRRRVALKVLDPKLGDVLGDERFLREIEIAARLTHPHILPLHDSGTAGGRLFYVMPFVDGESLRQRLLRESELPLDDMLYITKAVAGALDYAHGQGIIHRDIKPENILLQRGEPLVADFGIARAVEAAGGERLTETGLALGTPPYMSPEQASTGRLDARSDIYSLGCVAYEMLAGAPPFTGPTARSILARHAVDRVPPLRTVRPTVPPGVEAAIERALAKVPADRYATAGEFSTALERYPAAGAVLPSSSERWWKALSSRRAVGVLSAASVLALVAVLAYQARRPLLVSPAVQRQITFTGRTGAPAISPDGKWLAYMTSNEAGARDPAVRFSLKVQPLPSGDPVTLADSVFGNAPVWSPDGNSLMFVGRTRSSWFVGVQTVARAGGRVTQVAPLSWVYGYRPDGKAIVRATFDTLVIQDIHSGVEIQRISLAGKSGDVNAVDWAADGSWIALCVFRLGGDVIALIKPDGSGFRVLEKGCGPRWVGKHLYFTRGSEGGSDLLRLEVDLTTGRARGEPRLVLSGIGDGMSITRDATTLVYSRAPPDTHIWAVELNGPRRALRARTRQLTTDTRWHGSPDLSADGRSVAFLSDGGLYVVPFAGDSAPRWVATPAGDVVEPRWSPDGSKIAFALQDSSGAGLHVADLRTGRVTQVGRAPNIQPELTWSPDGQGLVFARNGRRQLFFLNLVTGGDSSFQWDPQHRVYTPRISPDGREIVATEFIGVNAMDGIARTTFGTGKWSHRATEIPNIRFLRWTRDGWIYAAVTMRSPANVYRMRGSGGALVPYFGIPIDCDIREMAMSADARRFVCTMERYQPDVWLVQNFDPTDQ